MPSAFEYQLELLKVEIDQINSSIRQMDEMTKSIKYWAIVTWTISLGATLDRPSLSPFVGLTAIIPLFFWLIDAAYRRIQRRFVYRIEQISKFLNDTRLKQSFEEQRLIGFQVLDPTAKKSRNDPEYKKFVSLSRILRFRSVYQLYFSLILISILVHLMVHKLLF